MGIARDTLKNTIDDLDTGFVEKDHISSFKH
jgi:hypothetical protein